MVGGVEELRVEYHGSVHAVRHHHLSMRAHTRPSHAPRAAHLLVGAALLALQIAVDLLMVQIERVKAPLRRRILQIDSQPPSSVSLLRPQIGLVLCQPEVDVNCSLIGMDLYAGGYIVIMGGKLGRLSLCLL